MALLSASHANAVQQTSLKAWGTSRAVRIPKVMCETAGIGVGSALIMESDEDDQGPFIRIRPAKTTHRSYADSPFVAMEELFCGYAGAYVPQEPDWGPDVGAEVVE